MQNVSTMVLKAAWRVFLAAILVSSTVHAKDPPQAIDLDSDRIIVRLKPSTAQEYVRGNAIERDKKSQGLAKRLEALAGESIQKSRTMADGSQVMRLNAVKNKGQHVALAAKLERDPDVLEVLPDRIFFPQFNPNDTQFAQQWALSAINGINAPGAWDISTGSPSLVIAILDTGSVPHADLNTRWIGGYDFVSAAERANDGGARDGDPADPGDWLTTAEALSGPLAGCPVTDSRWHGTAMAGVIGGAGNNSTGVAGINWNSRLLPVRVIGKCGGYESDIADGMRWSIGLPIPGVPNNPNPARLVNMSLAAAGLCSPVMQSAVAEVINAGVAIIAAAGNNNTSAVGFSPGNCSGVIAVGAVDKNGGKPTYSNFGIPIALSAPGGAGNANNEAVLTTFNQGLTAPNANADYYQTVVGTSIAAAHVTGVASLLLSITPELTPQNLRDILVNSARAFPTNTTSVMPGPSQADCTLSLCGRGILNAQLAAQMAFDWRNAIPQIATGKFHAVGLRSDGRVFTWGRNTLGQLGDGTLTGRTTPAPATFAGAKNIAAANRTTMVLRADRTVWSWGENTYGQLGDGSTTDRSAPVQVAGLAGVAAIAIGATHAIASRSDGSVWTWGRNDSGQLGDGTLINRVGPAPVPGLTGVIMVAASGARSYALKSDGTVWSWGDNASGALGDGTSINRSSPVQVLGLTNAVRISGSTSLFSVFAVRGDGSAWQVAKLAPAPIDAATDHLKVVSAEVTLSLKTSGQIWSWGNNFNGSLGRDAPINNYSAPAPIPTLSSMVDVAAAACHSMALKSDGTVWMWGYNANGQLGNGKPASIVNASTSDCLSPDVDDQPLPGMVLGVGGIGSLFLDLNSQGFIALSGLPNGGTQPSNPILISAVPAGSAISVSGAQYRIDEGAYTTAVGMVNPGQRVSLLINVPNTCGTTATATLTVAGVARTFSASTLACDTTPDPFTFLHAPAVPLSTYAVSNTVLITGINTATPVSVVGGEYSVGCSASFSSTPGSINNGQSICIRALASATNNTVTGATLTVGTVTVPFTVFSAVSPAFTAPAQVKGYFYHTLGLRTNGTVFAWGDNLFGELGDGSTNGSSLPVRALISGAIQVSAGIYYSAALRADGTVWMWGLNDGQLGDGTFVDRHLPQMVAGLTGVTAIATGESHILARKSDGSVWAWGTNTKGQLGDGTQITRTVPVQVPGLANVTHIAAGDGHSLARKADGSVVAWGDNFYGQLGDGTTTRRLTPIAISSLSAVSSVAAGGFQSAVLKTDTTVWSFGRGPNGNGVAGVSTVPVQATGLTGVIELVAPAHVMARKSDNTVWTWGVNDLGQVADGTLVDRLLPAQVVQTGFVSIGGGLFNGFGVVSSGTAVAWGDNEEGQLGFGVLAGSARTSAFAIRGEANIGTLNLDAAITTFAGLSGVALSSVNTSNTVVFNSIANGSAISITGGSYSIDGGPYVSAAGTINAGQSVTLRQSASPNCNTATTATLTVAALTRTYTVTTVACDTTPASVTFLNQASVAAGTAVTSNTVTVTGINQATPISISGGQYSIGCNGTFTAAAGTIISGQPLCIRITASGLADTVSTATVTIGTASFTFRVITEVAASYVVPPKIVGGAEHAIGLRSDGTVWGWGYNFYGQVGDGSTTNRRVPTAALLSGVQQVAAGAYFSMALRSDGTVWTWGRNDSGQLGDGTLTSRRVPQPVTGLANVTQISAGYDFALARKADGTIWAWGYNGNGELGTGTTVNSSTPVQITSLIGVASISAGTSHALAVKSDATLWSWGDNTYGQLGDGTLVGKTAPIQILSLAGVASVAAGGAHSLARKLDNTVFAWGYNLDGELGDGTVNSRSTPLAVPSLTSVVEIEADDAHSMARKADGSVWAWGGNANRQIGDGSTINRLTPFAVLGLPGAQAIGSGFFASYAIDSSGVVWSWGYNGSGGIGDGTLLNRATAVPIPSPGNDDYFHLSGTDTRPDVFAFLPAFGVVPNSQVTSNTIVISGLRNGVSAPVTVSGGVTSINGGAFSALGGSVVNGNTIAARAQSSSAFSTTTQAAVTVGGASGRTSTFYVRTRRDATSRSVRPQAAAGNGHSFVLVPNGTVVAAGYNGNGQLANGTTFSSPALRPIGGMAEVVSIASGDYHGIALKNDGSLLAWGYNASGQLGNGADTNTALSFVTVSGLTNIEAIAAGANHSLARKSDGTVWAWGLNNEGQAGNGSTTTRFLTPNQVPGLTGVTAIVSGSRHNLALLADGTLRAWGANDHGQLGDGSTILRRAPVTVSALTNVVAIAAAGNHSIALKADGTVVAWGNNDFGQLGDGSNTSRSFPVPVLGLTEVGLIAAGATHSLAVKTGGTLITWGGNANGQLGNGLSANRNTPLELTVPDKVIAIAGGQAQTIAITAAGKLHLFGDNYFGQLGNKSGNFNPHTLALNVLRGDATISGFGGNATSSTGSTSVSGSAVIDIGGLATDYDFGERTQGSATTIDGRFTNQALTEAISGVSVNLVNVTNSGYSLQSNNCGTPAMPVTVNAGSDCTFLIEFNPGASGDHTGRVELAANLIGSPEVRQLFGKGVAPAAPGLRLTTIGNLNYFLYEPQTVGTFSVPKTIVIANPGNAPLAVSSALLSSGANDFSVINASECASIAPGVSCNLDVQFNPAAPNSPNIRSGLVTLVTSAGTQTVTLEGAAAPNDGTTTGIALVSVVSRKNHGTLASPNIQNLPIDRTKAVGQAITTEPRNIGAGHQVVFQFNGAITDPGIVTLTDANGLPVNNATVSRIAQNNEVVVNIINLAAARRVTVSLVNVNGTASASAAVGFLVGDVTNSRSVNAADIAAVKARVNQPVDTSNFKYDVNASGTIDQKDVSAVKARAGMVVP